MKIDDYNKLNYIRSELYYRFKESECMCKTCKETIGNLYDEVNKLLKVFEKELENEK